MLRSLSAIVLTALLGVLSPGASAQMMHRFITSATDASISPSDCGGEIVASHGFYPLALAPGMSFPEACAVRIRNVDPKPVSGQTYTGGAKFLPFVSCTDGHTGSYLWPTHTIDVEVINGIFEPVQCPGNWGMPDNLVLNFDPVNGSSVWGQADGLATGARVRQPCLRRPAGSAVHCIFVLGQWPDVQCLYDPLLGRWRELHRCVGCPAGSLIISGR